MSINHTPLEVLSFIEKNSIAIEVIDAPKENKSIISVDLTGDSFINSLVKLPNHNVKPVFYSKITSEMLEKISESSDKDGETIELEHDEIYGLSLFMMVDGLLLSSLILTPELSTALENTSNENDEIQELISFDEKRNKILKSPEYKMKLSKIDEYMDEYCRSNGNLNSGVNLIFNRVINDLVDITGGEDYEGWHYLRFHIRQRISEERDARNIRMEDAIEELCKLNSMTQKLARSLANKNICSAFDILNLTENEFKVLVKTSGETRVDKKVTDIISHAKLLAAKKE